MENSLSIANYFIKKSFDEGIELTPMKLLKLVYIAHGWYLGLTENPLLNEGVEAWRYGPVIPSVYREFKQYGNNQITKLADTLTDQMQFITPMVEDDKHDFLNKIWNVYKKYNGLQLSTLTHQKGTPWYTVWYEENGQNRQGALISNNLIEDHYKSKQTSAIA